MTISGEHIVVDGDDSVSIIAGDGFDDDDGTVLIQSAGNVDVTAGLSADDDEITGGDVNINCAFSRNLLKEGDENRDAESPTQAFPLRVE